MSRESLLLVPGLLGDEALWRHQIDSLGDVADVAVADVAGADTMPGMASAILERAPERFALAGLSMGGYVVLEIMRQAPDRVSRLALVATTARADTPEQVRRRRGLIALTRMGQFRGVTPRLLPTLIHRAEDKPLATAIMDMAARVGRDAYVRQQTAIIDRKDGRADLAAIRCPTLVLCGRQDAIAPVALHEEMAAAIPGASLVIVEDAGHLVPMEQPHAVSAVFRYWLQVSNTAIPGIPY